jgi:hypothetical protein
LAAGEGHGCAGRDGERGTAVGAGPGPADGVGVAARRPLRALDRPLPRHRPARNPAPRRVNQASKPPEQGNPARSALAAAKHAASQAPGADRLVGSRASLTGVPKNGQNNLFQVARAASATKPRSAPNGGSGAREVTVRETRGPGRRSRMSALSQEVTARRGCLGADRDLRHSRPA